MDADVGGAYALAAPSGARARTARLRGVPLLAGGTVLAALPHVLFAARLIWILALAPMDNAMTQVLVGFDAVTLVAGYLISASWD
jgi:hypothetical protein